MEILENEKALKNFWSKVEKTDGCWNWTASCGIREGYGTFKVCGKMKRAHRVSFELHHKRAITEGMCILHSCDNRKCINPFHLSEGTYQDNIDDMVMKKRQHSKLTEEQVIEIRSKYSLGDCSLRKLGKEYEVTHSVVCDIVNRKYWKHI